MRQFNTNLAFVDLLFNLSVGLTCLFVMAFILINPIAKAEITEPPVIMLVELEWSDASDRDIDLHMRGPDGVTVSYRFKDATYMVLERDDTGLKKDTFELNGEEIAIHRNYEVISITALPPGEYVVNIHYYNKSGDPEDATVSITQIKPYKPVYTKTVTLTPNGETTILSFVVDDQKTIYDMNTNLHIPLAKGPPVP